MAAPNVPETNIAGNKLFWGLARRNILFYRRQNILLCAGCAISATILIGALLVGASLRESLLKIRERRIGNIEWALSSQSGYFRTDIADSLAEHLKLKSPATVAPVWPVTGSIGIAGGNESVHRVNIIGIDGRFRDLCKNPAKPMTFGDNSAIVNSALAEKLGIKIGDEVILRFQTAGSLAMEAPFGLRENLKSIRVNVAHIADGNDFGDFSLKAEHFTVYNVFVSLKLMQTANDMAGMTPMILIEKSPLGGHTYDKIMYGKDSEDTRKSVQNQLRIKDAGLAVRVVDTVNNIAEIYSDRVFIDERIKNIIVNAVPNSIPVSSWFVNSIDRVGSKYSTPYSFVSTPPEDYKLGENEIALTDWTAADLVAAIGDTVTLTYFVPLPTSGLRVDTAEFVVAAFLGDTVAWLDRSLMPPYPGLADAESCTDWNPSIPVDLSKIRSKDEEYWEKYAGTPKAVINYDRAMKIWGNRFGATTAIRVISDIDDIERAITPSLTPSVCGIRLTNIREAVSKAISGGTDFAPLFMGLSFFTLAASLLLIWLLSALHIKSRSEEHKILRALGYAKRQILLIYIAEGVVIFAAGTAVGVISALLYTSIIIWALKTVWSAAALAPDLALHIDWLSIITGGALAFFCALASMAAPMLSSRTTKKIRGKTIRPDKLTRRLSSRTFNERHLILRNILRDKKRTAGEAAILACALIILGTTQLFHNRPISDPARKSSGTGGFYWYGELDSGIPINETGAEFLHNRGIVLDSSANFSSLAMRLKDGDDASCLNLNQAQTPTLAGVDQSALDSLNAFSFASLIKAANKKHPWKILGAHTDNKNTIYGIADANTIEWGLGKSIGDSLTYINERGDTLKIILAASLKKSVMQGKVMIAESDFIRHFPSISGHRLLLLSPPADKEDIVAEAFRSYHDKNGLILEPSADRLNAFNAVENTYLSIFALLGMMGLALGCAGLGIIIARNIEERRYELAVMTAQGFGIDIIRRLLFKERAAVAAAGTGIGLLPAFIASVAAGGDIAAASILRMICLITIVLSCGAGSILIGLRGLRRDDLIEILKSENNTTY